MQVSYEFQLNSPPKFQKIISPERLAVLEQKFNKNRVWLILIGRHIVGLRAQIFITAGVVRMAPLKFLLIDTTSSTFTIALMAGAGYLGGNSFEIIKKDISRIEHILLFALILAAVIFIAFKYIKSSLTTSAQDIPRFLDDDRK